MWRSTLFVVSMMVLAGCAISPNPEAGTPAGITEAVVLASTLAPRTAESVTFEVKDATAADKVFWELGDGRNATGPSVTHAYDLPGSYIVRVTVTNGRGVFHNEATLTHLTISPPDRPLGAAAASAREPRAVLALERQVIRAGENVVVNATASVGFAANPAYEPELGVTPGNLPFAVDPASTANLSFAWDWGDGTDPATGPVTSHPYAAPGLYVVTLTVTDAAGRVDRVAASVLALATAPPVGGYKSRDLFVTATPGGPQSFDPGFDYETAGGHIIEQVYETLFTTDRGNTERVLPLLAAELPTVENGGILDGGTRYVIKLRQGVRFHDGTAFNASAVKFSFDRAILMNDPSSGAAVLAPILAGARDYRNSPTNTNSQAERDAWLAREAVKVIDEHTIQLTLDAPNAAFFQRLAFYGTSILSPSAVLACHEERVPLWGACKTPDGLPPPSDGRGVAVTRDPWADANAVGTGPFKLRKWLPGDRVILDRNDDYWGPAPALRTVIVQYVDDLNTRLLMLRSGDADDVYIPPDQIDRVKPSIDGIARFVAADTLIIDAFFFNYDVKDPDACPVLASGETDCQLFEDIEVRKAFAHAFDYDSFFNDVWKGRARPLAGVIPRGMPGYDADLAPYARDEAAARAALAASRAADGFSVSCTFNVGNTVRQGACELIKQNLEALLPGKIQVDVTPLPADELIGKMQAGRLPFWILGWSPDYIATDDYIEPFLHSRGSYPVSQGFHDEDLDALIEVALAETDPVKQAAMYARINRRAVESYVDIFLDQRTSTHVERTYVQGYYYSALHSGSPVTGDYSVISKA